MSATDRIKSLADLDKHTVYFDLGTDITAAGKHSFVCLWWDDLFHRGPCWRTQACHAVLTRYVAAAKRKGFKTIAGKELLAESVYRELREEAAAMEELAKAERKPPKRAPT